MGKVEIMDSGAWREFEAEVSDVGGGRFQVRVDPVKWRRFYDVLVGGYQTLRTVQLRVDGAERRGKPVAVVEEADRSLAYVTVEEAS